MSLTKVKLAKLLIAEKKPLFLVETILETIKLALAKGENVKISGFGKWTVKEKRSRVGRNPHTNEHMTITARKVVTFHPSQKFNAMFQESEKAVE